MSLIEPTWIDFAKKHKTALIAAGLTVVLVLVATGLYSCGDNYLFKSKIQKQKDEITADTDKLANATAEIHELEKTKAAAQANVNAATQELQNNIFGLEKAKEETNAALANLAKAVNANTNVDRSAEDLKRALDKLDQ